MPKCREILSQLPQSAFIDNVFPSAAHMPFFSFRKYLKEQFEDLAYFEPFYLKDFHIHTRKKPS
jgi:tRNA threonylcarbamoyladenosine biosynthesis protein TsaB